MSRSRLVLAACALAASLLPVPAGGASSPDRARKEPAAASSIPGGTPELYPASATRVFTIRYRNVDDVYLLISPLLGPVGSIRTQPRQRTITVADTPETLNAVAQAIAAYDIPPRSVSVSVQLILASSGAGGSPPAPPPVRGVIEKLNALSTRWNDYRMVGDARILGTEGERSSLRIGDDYRVDFRIEQVSEESRTIRFKPFELSRRELSVEGNERYSPVMNTVLNLRDSQLFIVGASKLERSNRALFMTITAALPQP